MTNGNDMVSEGAPVYVTDAEGNKKQIGVVVSARAAEGVEVKRTQWAGPRGKPLAALS